MEAAKSNTLRSQKDLFLFHKIDVRISSTHSLVLEGMPAQCVREWPTLKCFKLRCHFSCRNCSLYHDHLSSRLGSLYLRILALKSMFLGKHSVGKVSLGGSTE